MGMYTEIIFGAGLKSDTPEDVISTIQKLIDVHDLEDFKPDHAFFRTMRWDWLLSCGGSYYFPGVIKPQFWHDEISGMWYLHFRTNIKNYDSEIEKFIDWIEPYVYQGSGKRDFYAIVIYEDNDEPKIYYKQKNGD